jgi:hypothetical protein
MRNLRQDRQLYSAPIWKVVILALLGWSAGAQTVSFDRTDISTGIGPQRVASADFNGDGNADIAVLNSGDGSLSILISNGDGTFQPPRTTVIAVSPRAMAVGDVNGDGFPDVITDDLNNVLHVLLGNGDGTFQAASTIQNAVAAGIAIGDFNGDGKADLAAADFSGDRVVLHLGKGDGTFLAPSFVSAGAIAGTKNVVAVDLNGDGKLDLVTVNMFSNNISVLIGNGDGSFKTPVLYALLGPGSSPQALACGDINGDGIPDVIVAVTGQFKIAVFLGNGDGTITHHGDLTLPRYVFDIAIGDVNADRKADLITSTDRGTPDSSFATILLGNNDGTFGMPVDYAVAAGSASVVAGDFNGDGILDVVTADTSGSSVTLLSNTSVPGPLAVTPGGGSGFGQTFTFTFLNATGFQNLGVVNILINNFLDGGNACYLAYSQPLNTIYLVNDPGNALLPGLVMNGSGSVGNSQCTVIGAGSTAVGNGNILTLTLDLSFGASFAGDKVIYLAAGGTHAGNSGWQARGVWRVPGTILSGPDVGGASPARSKSAGQVYTFTFVDTNGWPDLGIVNILINDFLDGRKACYLAYVRSLNFVYLVNDSGARLLPGLVVGSGFTNVGNSQCTLHGVGSSAVGVGNTLTLSLNLSFSSGSANRIVYVAARSNSDIQNSGWKAIASVIVP